MTTPIATGDGGDEFPPAVRSAKMDIEDAPVDAVMLQPAAPTLDVTTPLSEPSMSPKQPTAEASPTSDAAPVAATSDGLEQDAYASDSEWFDNMDTESGTSQSEDTRVAPLDFRSSATNGHHGNDRSEEELTQSSDARESVGDLISLPSPVVTDASTASFDVFATSPAKHQPSATSVVVDAGSTSHEAASHEKPSAETLTPTVSALALSSSAAEEPPTSHEDTAAAAVNQQQASDWIADATEDAPPVEILNSLSIAVPAPATTKLDTCDSESGVSPLLSPERQQQSLSSVSGAPAQQLDSRVEAPSSTPPSPDDTATAPESLTKSRIATELEPHTEQPTMTSQTKTLVQDTSAPPAPAAVRNTRVSASAARPTGKGPPPPSKASKVPHSSTSAESKPAGTVTKDAKPKNGRVTSHTTALKAKTNDSVKVKAPAPVPTRTGVVKPKPVNGHDNAASSSRAVAPSSKPRAATAVSAIQKCERVPRTAAKPPTPAPPASPRGDGAATKHKIGSATPPPAPVSATESDGPKSIKKRLSASELEAASNRLYSDAIESKKRKEVLKAELEESFSFAPQVNATKRSVVPDEKNRFVQLHEKAKEAAKRKEELKKKREKSECTFKPKITTKAKKLSSKSAKPRYENLYQQAHEIKQKREEKKHESDQKAVDECSFKPKIKAIKSPLKPRPLYDAERLKQKKLALEQKKLATELSECTFKPKVVVAKTTKTKGDDAAASKPGGDGKLFDRLYQASQKRAENLEKLRLEHEQQVKAVATFHPKITSTGTAKSGASKQPFHERLYSKDHMQKVTADREQKKLEGEQRFSYKPQITAVPDEAKSKPGSASNSPDKSIFERLYDEKDKLKEKIELSEAIKKQKEMVGCTFHPCIEVSPNHSKEAPSAPIWERLLNYDKHQVLEERERQRQQLEMQECTFKPEVTPSEYFTPKKSPSAGIFDRLTGGGAASMPSTDMKRRESERRGSGSVQYHKRRSVPELGAFKDPSHAASIGAILKASSVVLTPEKPADDSANQPRSGPPSLQHEPETTSLERAKVKLTVPTPHPPTMNGGDSIEAAKSRRAETLADERASPEDASSGANNTEQPPISHGPSAVVDDDDDLWTSSL